MVRYHQTEVGLKQDNRTSDFGRFPKIFWYGRKIGGTGQRKRVQRKKGIILYIIILYTNIYIIYKYSFRL